MVFSVLILCLAATSPLLEVTESIDRGATAVYTVSLQEETVYWITLICHESTTDLNVSASSNEMDFEHFMNLPYREDFLYALEFALASGLEPGDESVTLPADYSGPYYIIIHDAGGSGGTFTVSVR